MFAEGKLDNETWPLVDSHCHLDLEQFDAERDEIVARARRTGVRWIVNPGIDLEHSQRALGLTNTYPDLYVAVGIHPNSADQCDGAAIEALRQMATHPKVVAIGEIGLDYYWKDVPANVQRSAFERQLSLAEELGLPVIIHNRDANDDIQAVLRNWVNSASFAISPLHARSYVGVLHAFSGDPAMAEAAYDWRFILGLGGPVTFKNAKSLHELVPQLRLDRLMLETDAPYLTPHPYRGQRNEPAYVRLICEQLAALFDRKPVEIAEITTSLAFEFFFGEDRFGAYQPASHAITNV